MAPVICFVPKHTNPTTPAPRHLHRNSIFTNEINNLDEFREIGTLVAGYTLNVVFVNQPTCHFTCRRQPCFRSRSTWTIPRRRRWTRVSPKNDSLPDAVLWQSGQSLAFIRLGLRAGSASRDGCQHVQVPVDTAKGLVGRCQYLANRELQLSKQCDKLQADMHHPADAKHRFE